MITPSFALTATERVLPRLVLDFTTASLDPRVTFTRSGATATRVNSSGYIETVAADTPRFDFDPVTLACRGLLIEEIKTNRYRYSDDFANNTVWAILSSSVSTISLLNPSGSTSTQKIIDTTANATHGLNQTASVVSGTAYTQSVYVKAAETTKVALFLGANGWGTAVLAIYDLIAVTASVTTGTGTATITNAGNGWYRLTLTGTATLTAATANTQIRLCDSAGNTTYVGNGIDGAYFWGPQFEAGAFATSYIPTTTTAVTRNADVATMTGTNFSSWWTATTGSANVSATQKSIGGTAPLVQFDDNTANNIISLRGNAANPELYIKATTDQAQINAGTIVANTAYKLTGTWTTDNCAAAQNGAAAVTDTSATIPTVTQARIGSDGTNYANAWLQKINYWPQRITNNEVQAFSK